MELQGNLKAKLTGQAPNENQMTFFTPTEDPIVEEIKATIKAMDVNNLTPVEALNKIQELKEKIKE